MYLRTVFNRRQRSLLLKKWKQLLHLEKGKPSHDLLR